MPILKREPSIYPEGLLSPGEPNVNSVATWWCFSTIARTEKEIARRLFAQKIPFYCPIVGKRFRSPQGRMRESFVPLFPGYIFVSGDESHRIAALKTNKLSRCQPVVDSGQLVDELRRIQLALESGVPLTPEAKIVAGDPIRVRGGPFAGYEGFVLRREGKTRLLLAIKFIEQGVSMEIDEAMLEKI